MPLSKERAGDPALQWQDPFEHPPEQNQELIALLDWCVPSEHRGHANPPSTVPILTDYPRREPVGFIMSTWAWSWPARGGRAPTTKGCSDQPSLAAMPCRMHSSVVGGRPGRSQFAASFGQARSCGSHELYPRASPTSFTHELYSELYPGLSPELYLVDMLQTIKWVLV